MLIEGLFLAYLVVTTGAMAMTWHEHLQASLAQGSLPQGWARDAAGVAAGLLACMLWPLACAAILLELRRRGG